MIKVQQALTFALRKLWTVIAVLLVLFALLISAFRYSLPLANNYKPQIQDYIASQYGIELRIGDISAEWQASGPKLLLQEVELRQQNEAFIALDVENVEMIVDFWPTLFNRKLRSKDVSLNNLQLQIRIDDTSSQNTELTIVNLLEKVFLEQLENFSVTDSTISLLRNQYTQSVNLPQIEWLNEDQRHQARGSLTLNNFANESIAFVLDLQGNINDYSGVFYALGQQLDVSPWINKLTDFDTELKSSDVNFEMWATIESSQFSDITANLLPTTLDWQGMQTEVTSAISAAAQARKVDNKWLFTINDMLIELDDDSFTTQWFGEWGVNHPFVLQASQQFELDNWFPLLGIVDRDLAKWLENSEIALSLDKPSLLYAENKIGIQVPDATLRIPQKSITPGFDDLHFSLNWFDSEGVITVKQEQLVLQSQTMFKRDMVLNNLDLLLRLKTQSTGVVMSAKDFSFSADDLKLSGSALYNSNDRLLSVEMASDGMPLNQVPNYLPHKLMKPKAIDYLTRAFTGKGNVDGFTAIWHGQLDAFPFKNNEGIFSANVDISDADFVFSPKWPALTQLDINLNFLNNGLFMSSPTTKLADVTLSDLSAHIPNLGRNSVLSIDAIGEGTGEQLTDLMNQSSLKKRLGRVLSEQVRVSGDLTSDLSLVIPLSNARKLIASGDVKLNNNRVNIAALNIDLTEANGVLTFVNERLDIEAMDAAFLDQPIQVDLSARQNQTYELDFDVSGSWDIEQSLERFQIDLEDKLSGTFEYQLGVDISVDKQDYTYAALLSSDLLTTNSSLPFPLNKSEGQIKVVEVEAKGDKIASMISVSIDDDVHFDGTLPHKEKQFNRAHLSLGQTDMQPTSMGVGFSISANLDQLVFDDWFTALKGISAAGTGDSQNRILGVPERIFLNIERFNIGGYNLTDVNSITRHNEDNWTIDFNSDQARFSALIDEQLYAQGISVDADYIKLTSNDIAGATVEKSPLDLDPKKLPPLDFNCSDCTFKQYKLGKIELETTPNSDGLTVEQLLVEGNSANLIAKGQWYKGAEDHYTYFAGDFNSGDVGLFLQSLNVDAGIRDSGANVGFALTWDDSPFDFKGENLNGELKWNLSDGYLSEVSDKGSRIFTLLSLDSLVRKLSLDFRDVFAKGFFYDEMGGTISITQGKADTRDTLIDGAAGEIEIYGYTDLATKALNYNVSFTPNVTGNLPVLVYFFTVSPPSALAALALDQVLTSAKVISNVNYSVTGTIDEPILIETGRQSTEVELPARVPENDVSSTPFVAPIPEDFLKFETQ